jgi:hypothetical protein
MVGFIAERMLSLETITQDEPFILVDSNIDSVQTGAAGWYRDAIYPTKRFCEMDIAVLDEVQRNVVISEAFFSHDSVHTVPRVAEEMAKIGAILKDKQTCLAKYEKKARSRDSNTWRKVDDEQKSERRELFADLCWRFDKLARKAALVTYRPQDSAVFETLYSVALNVAALTHAKVDFGVRYGDPSRVENDIHADEELVATALYRTMVEREPCAIVSMDTDIIRITRWVHRYLGAIDPAIRVYCRMPSDTEYGMYIDTAQVPKKFHLPSADKRLIDLAQEALHKLPLEIAKPFL